MTDDLVKRLRDKNCCDASHCNCDEAADRIEALWGVFQETTNKWHDALDRIEALEAAYTQQQQVWSDAIARADRYEAALREIIMCWNYEQCAGLARAALGEKKDEV